MSHLVLMKKFVQKGLGDSNIESKNNFKKDKESHFYLS